MKKSKSPEPKPGTIVAHLNAYATVDGGTLAATYRRIPCGCRIIGNGTLPHPLDIQFCPMHAAAKSACEPDPVPKLTKPTIHMNGTTADELLEAYRRVHTAICDAIHEAELATPNGRDYYPQGPHAIDTALKENRSRVERLASVAKEYMELADHCFQFVRD